MRNTIPTSRYAQTYDLTTPSQPTSKKAIKKKYFDMPSKFMFGRDESRTHDLLLARQTRYQLRHTPILQAIVNA